MSEGNYGGRDRAIPRRNRRLPRAAQWVLGCLFIVAMMPLNILVYGNLFFATPRDIPYRALAPDSPACATQPTEWDSLAKVVRPDGANKEWNVIDSMGSIWRRKFACVVQHHVLPGYKAKDGSLHDLKYDLDFIEFQEDGKPYALRTECGAYELGCRNEGYGPVKRDAQRVQLDAVIKALDPSVPNYVIVWVHGWRNDASIGNGNVAELRAYAAFVARALVDRNLGVDPKKEPRVTAIYIGWRGSRTDEGKLSRQSKWFTGVGALSAMPTLFDRKPVSETIAPSVIAALHRIEYRLHLSDRGNNDTPDTPPQWGPQKMIVFGHSLGGNLLISGLHDDLIKRIEMFKQPLDTATGPKSLLRCMADSHKSEDQKVACLKAAAAPEEYMQPVLGNLVVLINPAAEATKWIDIQEAVWRRIALAKSERYTGNEYTSSHDFFQINQVPLVVSVTAARDWPPGGLFETDCGSDSAASESAAAGSAAFEYDWATYDMFPAFKGDFRPLADTIERLAWGNDPHNPCDKTTIPFWRYYLGYLPVKIADFLRLVPFQETNPLLTHTVGNIDPPRVPYGSSNNDYFSSHPFGATGELRPAVGIRENEKPLEYLDVLLPKASCPVANYWLLFAREQELKNDPTGHGTYWDSNEAGTDVAGHNATPALEVTHGFCNSGIAPISRANDPFWNLRAFNTVLAQHNGYMFASFICGMNQMVMDDIAGLSAPAPNIKVFVKQPKRCKS